MRFCALSVALCLFIGCGEKKAPAKAYWDEETRMQMFQGAVQGLSEASKKPGNFVVPAEGAQRSDFTFNLQISIGSADLFLKEHGESENAPAIRDLLKEIREVEATNPTKPDPQLTAKLSDLSKRALALKMRPMTPDEEKSVQKSLN